MSNYSAAMAEEEAPQGQHGTESGELGFKDKIDLWHRYESVAMHFNDLLIRFRLQALGGMAALVTVLTFCLEKVPVANRSKTLAILCLVLAVIWFAILVIDQLYYQRLLLGAVEAIKDLESTTNKTIVLSTTIDGWFTDRGRGWKYHYGPISFYGLVLLLLLIGALVFSMDEPSWEFQFRVTCAVISVALLGLAVAKSVTPKHKKSKKE